MGSFRRVLIIDSSRWESFRLRNQFYKYSSSNNITIMAHASAGLDELARASYDIAVFDFSTILAYEINERKFICDFAETTENCHLIIVDGTNNPGLKTLILKQLAFHLDSDRVTIINKDDQTHQVIPTLTDKFAPKNTSTATTKADLTSGLGIEEMTHPTNIQGRLAHEVNNPLMTITGTIELLLDNPDYSTGDIGRKLRIIKRSTRRIRVSIGKIDKEMSLSVKSHQSLNRLAENNVLSKI